MGRFVTGFGAAVLLAGVAWFFTGAAPTDAQEKAAAARWEYTMTNGGLMELNKLGADGWELATTHLNPSGVSVHTLKRQKR